MTGNDNSYEMARAALLDAELALMQQREHVAELRRSLPPGPIVADYSFTEADGAVRLSQLFSSPDRPLVVYHFMYGKRQTDPCPMCSMWTDGWAAVARHLEERLDFALVTAASITDTLELAKDRGWQGLRWLSAADSSFKRDIGGEDGDGNQWPFISAYSLTDDGVRLTYSGSAHLRDEHWRGLDLLSPVWHMLDLTPQGRGEWMPH
jgi:predicted dithiol-disulfide oxidoreductase (DUF899 family)